MLAAHRAAPERQTALRPFPSIECNALATVKRIVAGSDTITAFTLSSIATELETRRYALLGTEPWLCLRYGVVRLKGRPLTPAAEKFLELVLDAERAATLEEQRLLARFGPSPARRRARPAKTKTVRTE